MHDCDDLEIRADMFDALRKLKAEFRAMLAPRRFAIMQEQMAIDATLTRLEHEALLEAAPAIYAILGRPHAAAVPVPSPVVMPEPASPPAPVPVVICPGAPDGLRQRLGLH